MVWFPMLLKVQRGKGNLYLPILKRSQNFQPKHKHFWRFKWLGVSTDITGKAVHAVISMAASVGCGCRMPHCKTLAGQGRIALLFSFGVTTSCIQGLLLDSMLTNLLWWYLRDHMCYWEWRKIEPESSARQMSYCYVIFLILGSYFSCTVNHTLTKISDIQFFPNIFFGKLG